MYSDIASSSDRSDAALTCFYEPEMRANCCEFKFSNELTFLIAIVFFAAFTCRVVSGLELLELFVEDAHFIVLILRLVSGMTNILGQASYTSLTSLLMISNVKKELPDFLLEALPKRYASMPQSRQP